MVRAMSTKMVLGNVSFRGSPGHWDLQEVLLMPTGPGHRALCRQWVLPLFTGFNCDFSITWPGACFLALVGPCSAENCRLFLLNRAINYLHYLHIATY